MKTQSFGSLSAKTLTTFRVQTLFSCSYLQPDCSSLLWIRFSTFAGSCPAVDPLSSAWSSFWPFSASMFEAVLSGPSFDLLRFSFLCKIIQLFILKLMGKVARCALSRRYLVRILLVRSLDLSSTFGPLWCLIQLDKNFFMITYKPFLNTNSK